MSNSKAEDTPPSPNAAADPVAPPRQKVHPLAKKLAGLLSPMSLKDQEAASFWCTAILGGSLAVFFPIAYWLQSMLVVVSGVFGAALVSAAVCVPNWRQRRDEKLKFANDHHVWDYYQQLKKARARAEGAGEADDADPSPLTE